MPNNKDRYSSASEGEVNNTGSKGLQTWAVYETKISIIFWLNLVFVWLWTPIELNLELAKKLAYWLYTVLHIYGLSVRIYRNS